MSRLLGRLNKLNKVLKEKSEEKQKEVKVFVIKPHHISRNDLKADSTNLKESIKNNLSSWYKKALLPFKPVRDYLKETDGKGKILLIIDDLNKDDNVPRDLDNFFNKVAANGYKKTLINFMKEHYLNAKEYLTQRIKLPVPHIANDKTQGKVLTPEEKEARRKEIEAQLKELDEIQKKKETNKK